MKKVFGVASFLAYFCMMSFAHSAEVITGDDKGIITLLVDKAEIRNVTTGKDHAGVIHITPWKNNKGIVTWNINTGYSRAEQYIFEYSWTSSDAWQGTLVVKVNDKNLINHDMGGGLDDNLRRTTRLKQVTLSSGNNVMEVTAPKAGGPVSFRLYGIRLIPTSLVKSIGNLRKQSVLNLTLDQIELAYGRTFPGPVFDLGEGGSGAGDKLSLLQKECTGADITIDKKDTYYFAIKDGKCLGVKVFPAPKMADAIKMLQTISPGIKIDTKGYKKGKDFVSIMQSISKTYKFYYKDAEYATLVDVSGVVTQ